MCLARVIVVTGRLDMRILALACHFNSVGTSIEIKLVVLSSRLDEEGEKSD